MCDLFWVYTFIEHEQAVLTIAKAFRPKVLCKASFTIEFILFSQSCWLKTLSWLGTIEIVFVPGIPALITFWAAYMESPHLEQFSAAPYCWANLELSGLVVRLNNLWFDAQSLTTICIMHVGTSGNHSLWPTCLSIAGFAVDCELPLLCWDFPSNHAQEAAVVEASPVTVYFSTWYQVFTQAPGYFHFSRHLEFEVGQSTVGRARVEGVLGDSGSPGKFYNFGYKDPYFM